MRRGGAAWALAWLAAGAAQLPAAPAVPIAPAAPDASPVPIAPAAPSLTPAPAPPPRPDEAEPAPLLSEPYTLGDVLGWALTDLALLDLRGSPEGDPADDRVALEVLRVARRYAPRDTELLRLTIDAADSAGHAELVRQLTAELVRLEPRDTVAQLSLMRQRLELLQSVAARRQALEKVLGPDGATLDPAVRSRLAMDASELARQAGDTDRSLRLVVQAVRLDPSNRDAARVALGFYTSRLSDPVGRLELLLNLLVADPIDPDVIADVARQLVEHGAADSAGGLVRLLFELRSAGVRVPGGETIETWHHLSRWLSLGVEEASRLLFFDVRRERQTIQALRDDLAERGIDEFSIANPPPKPESVRLPLHLERIRLVAAHAAGDHESAAESARDLLATVAQLEGWVAEPETVPPGASVEVVRERLEPWLVEAPWLCLMTGQELGPAAKRVEGLLSAQGRGALPEGTRRLLTGWLALRQGRPEEAAEQLGAIERAEPLASLGLAALAESAGAQAGPAPGPADRAQAERIYAELWQAYPGEYVGLYARERAARLAGQPPADPPLAEPMRRLIDGLPAWVSRAVLERGSFMSVDVTPSRPSAGLFDPVLLRARVRNLAPVPLPAGPDAPLRTDLLLAPIETTGLIPIEESRSPIITGMAPRLRLAAGEQAETTVRGDTGYAGWYHRCFVFQRTSLTWRYVQGYGVDGLGRTVAGPFARSGTAGPTVRAALPAAPPGEVVSRLSRLDAEAGPEFLLAVRQGSQALIAAEWSKLTAQDRAALSEALAGCYRRQGALGRLLMLTHVPPASAVPELAAYESAVAAEAEPDDGVLLVKCLVMANRAGAGVLDALGQRQGIDPAVRAHVRDR
ncbi:MAG: hypothetical protein C0468_01890, partial [Planctomyces sp.]|nr:hypothetical protein [Planctomyces sp.]